jgi:hypothetical protein
VGAGHWGDPGRFPRESLEEIMVASTTTQPNKAADFWDSVYTKTGSEAEATRQTMAKFGPPKSPTGKATADSIMANPGMPRMEGVESGSSSAAIPQPRMPPILTPQDGPQTLQTPSKAPCPLERR